MKQVFPSLRRRAKSRGVDIVDVDLRWGVTAEQTESGEMLPLCLAEIDNCRPYFISLLGERYGWVPPPDFYKPALLELQPWLMKRMGGVSVTELEILHGVLRNPEMAGHALFYLRDPAYAQAQQGAGWVAENPAEQQRLQALKQQICASGFPVVNGLQNPQAIAKRIEADLWDVIERENPEQAPPDALQREGQRHSDYRRSRTRLYLGGEASIEQLDRWIAEGEQRILITGESGAGKSTLIANWLEAHQRNAPQDLVHAHHLGCTNDASAVRPLLGRLIDTASQLLLAEGQIPEPLKVPQDWWELVFKVGEILALLSSWCQKQGCRWILVLDGLDRLAEDDQQALPWIPTTLPPGIHVVATSLECPARSILQGRQYRRHDIGPLGKAEQQQLIDRYLSRFTKQLESGLQQKILAHKLAGSPLFLKVLLEELRQCGWYDTLMEQLEFYLAAETIDGLYGKVLERLERDGHGDASRKALTALWASRAGLSETELLAVSKLAPLEWAPIDLALEQAFGWNDGRLVFDHDYLRLAVELRWLQASQDSINIRANLVQWFMNRRQWDARSCFEIPWQLIKMKHIAKLKQLIMMPEFLNSLVTHRGAAESYAIWGSAFSRDPSILKNKLQEIFENPQYSKKLARATRFKLCNSISILLVEAGLTDTFLIKSRKEAYKLCDEKDLKAKDAAFINMCEAYNLCGFPEIRDRLFLKYGRTFDRQSDASGRLKPIQIRERFCELAEIFLLGSDNPANIAKEVKFLLNQASHLLGYSSLLCHELHSLYAACAIRQGDQKKGLKILLDSVSSIEVLFGGDNISLLRPLAFLLEHFEHTGKKVFADDLRERIKLLSKQVQIRPNLAIWFKRNEEKWMRGDVALDKSEALEWFNSVFAMRKYLGSELNISLFVYAAQLGSKIGEADRALDLADKCLQILSPLGGVKPFTLWLACIEAQAVCLCSLNRANEGALKLEEAFSMMEIEELDVETWCYARALQSYADITQKVDTYKHISALQDCINFFLAHSDDYGDNLQESLAAVVRAIADCATQSTSEKLEDIESVIAWFSRVSDESLLSIAATLRMHQEVICNSNLVKTGNDQELIKIFKLCASCFDLADEELLLQNDWARHLVCSVRSGLAEVLVKLGFRSDAIMQLHEIARLVRHSTAPNVHDLYRLDSASWGIFEYSGAVESDLRIAGYCYFDFEFFEQYR